MGGHEVPRTAGVPDGDDEGISARRPDTPACPDCGRPQELRPTAAGHWVLLEPEPLPVAEVPDGRQWFLGEDGRAVGRRRGAPPPSEQCRIAHLPVCGRQEFSAHRAPLCNAVWLGNRAREGLPYE
ncbi:DUF6083 domain-containing protein [Streptomyces sp. I05A-00742]|uniref:DUF6083 domain-containing protein n=1 Tax=Streptomyces sp. I05A-00742 TaxID=2732853 RepID=UPI00148A0E2C|nr:DUF6083 domain-containing protein [Streptomyces sp. I05A-00742]